MGAFLTKAEATRQVATAVAAETARIAAEIAELEAQLRKAEALSAPAPVLRKADARPSIPPGETSQAYLAKADAETDPTARLGYRDLAKDAAAHESQAPAPRAVRPETWAPGPALDGFARFKGYPRVGR
jgi:hypothetical protein